MQKLKRMLKRNSKLISVLALGAFMGVPVAHAAPKDKCLNFEKLFAEMKRPGIEIKQSTTDMKVELNGARPASLSEILAYSIESSDPARKGGDFDVRLSQEGCESITWTSARGKLTQRRIISFSPSELVLEGEKGQPITLKLVAKNKLITTDTFNAHVQDPSCPNNLETKIVKVTQTITMIWGLKGTLKDLEVSDNLRSLLSEVLTDVPNPAQCTAINNGIYKPNNAGSLQNMGGGGTSSEHGSEPTANRGL